MSAENTLTEWAKQTRLLPAQRTAVQLWAQENSYILFVQGELELAQPFPDGANSTMLNILGNAIFDVISLTKSPQVAAQEAIDALQQ